MQCVLKAGASEFWYPWIVSMGIAWSCISLYHFIILYPDLVVTLARIIIIYVWVSAFLLPPWTLAFLPPQSAVKCMPGWKPWHMGQTYSEEQITRLQCKRNNFFPTLACCGAEVRNPHWTEKILLLSTAVHWGVSCETLSPCNLPQDSSIWTTMAPGCSPPGASTLTAQE